MLCFIILLTIITASCQRDLVSNKVITSDKHLKYKSDDDGDFVMDPKVGHGIFPNYTPSYSPPVHTEHVPGMQNSNYH